MLDWTGLVHGLQTGNFEPTKYNLIYQAKPEKFIREIPGASRPFDRITNQPAGSHH